MIKPIIKYAGGKSKLLPHILAELPSNYNTYVEPFVGGGALLFALCPRQAIVADINCEIINTYVVVRDNLLELLTELDSMENTPESFYAVRQQDPMALTAVKRATRFIYLNKTCFNGLYRENSKGQFNVPFGNYKNPKFYDVDNIGAVADYLKNAQKDKWTNNARN